MSSTFTGRCRIRRCFAKLSANDFSTFGTRRRFGGFIVVLFREHSIFGLFPMQHGDLLVAMLLFKAETLVVLVENEVVEFEGIITVACVVATTVRLTAAWSLHDCWPVVKSVPQPSKVLPRDGSLD